MISRKMITVLALAVIALAGCSAQKMTMMGSERTIEKSGDKPDWVYEIPKKYSLFSFGIS